MLSFIKWLVLLTLSCACVAVMAASVQRPYPVGNPSAQPNISDGVKWLILTAPLPLRRPVA